MRNTALTLFVFLFCVSCWSGMDQYEPVPCVAEGETGKSGGCCDTFLFQLINDTAAVTIEVSRNTFIFTRTCTTVVLTPELQNVKVNLQVSRNHPDSVYFHYCSPAKPANCALPREYKAISGGLTLQLENLDALKDQDYATSYRVSASLYGVQFAPEAPDDLENIEKIIINDVTAGWWP